MLRHCVPREGVGAGEFLLANGREEDIGLLSTPVSANVDGFKRQRALPFASGAAAPAPTNGSKQEIKKAPFIVDVYQTVDGLHTQVPREQRSQDDKDKFVLNAIRCRSKTLSHSPSW